MSPEILANLIGGTFDGEQVRTEADRTLIEIRRGCLYDHDFVWANGIATGVRKSKVTLSEIATYARHGNSQRFIYSRLRPNSYTLA